MVNSIGDGAVSYCCGIMPRIFVSFRNKVADEVMFSLLLVRLFVRTDFHVILWVWAYEV